MHLNKWIHLGSAQSNEQIVRQTLYEQLYTSRAQPTPNNSDAFGDLRALIQEGFTGGETWKDWAAHFQTELQREQLMGYLSGYFGTSITSMTQLQFEFDFFALRTLHQKMEDAELHHRYDKPDTAINTTAWGLEPLTQTQLGAWEEQHQRTLPNALKRVYTSLFGGSIFSDFGEVTNTWLMSHPAELSEHSAPSGPYPNLITLEESLRQEGVDDCEQLFSHIQHALNQLFKGSTNRVSMSNNTSTPHPMLSQALVLERYIDLAQGADYITILIEFGSHTNHVVELQEMTIDPERGLVCELMPLEHWLINTYLNAWLDIGV